MTSTRTTPAPIRYEPGDIADIVDADGTSSPYVFHDKTGAWSGRRGFIYDPQPPPVPHRLREPVYAEPPSVLPEPTRLRERLADGSSQVIPLPPLVDHRYYEVIVAPVGSFEWVGPGQAIVRSSLNELASLTSLHEGKPRP